MITLIFASESTGLLDSISLGRLVVALIFLAVLALVVRTVVDLNRHPPAPVSSASLTNISESIVLLSISVILLIGGTIISLTISDALGGSIASIGGVFSMVEQRRRHKREGNPDPPLFTRKK